MTLMSQNAFVRQLMADIATLERDRAQMAKLIGLLISDAQQSEDGAVWLRITPQRLEQARCIVAASQEVAQ